MVPAQEISHCTCHRVPWRPIPGVANSNINVSFSCGCVSKLSSKRLREQGEQLHVEDQRLHRVFHKLLSFRIFRLGPQSRGQVQYWLVLAKLNWIDVRGQCLDSDYQRHHRYYQGIQTS